MLVLTDGLQIGPNRKEDMKSRLFLSLILLAVLAAGGYFIWKRYFTVETPRYITAPVATGTVSETVLASGILKPVKLVAVGAQVSGRITALHVKPGDELKEGDLVAEIDSVPQQNDVRKAKAALTNVQAQLSEKQANLENARTVLDRQKQVYESRAGALADLQTAQTNLKAIEAQIAALQAQIVEAEVAVATAETDLGYTRITAPMAGTVLAVVNQEGRTVNANQSVPTIVILGELDTMTVRAEISEADIVRVKTGQKVRFNIVGEPGKQYDAVLAAIEPAPESITSDSAVVSSTSSGSTSSSSSASSSAVYYIGTFDIDNKDRRFRTYMTAEVRVILGEAKDALTVPSSALVAGKEGTFVRVQKADGSIERRKVEVGLNNKTLAEIKSGLEKDERVVVGEGAADRQTSSSSRRGGPPPMF